MLESKKAGHSTVPDTFATGQRAATVLRSLLPNGWLFREQNPDFHIDFIVEVVESGELTGVNFGIQLKGTQRKKGKALSLKYSLKTKHLRYYLHKATVPVFLVLVDTVNGKAYWRFTQKFARERGPAQALEGKGTVSVPFQENDCFDNLDRFNQALRDSIAYMRDLRPGSIVAAVEAEKAKLSLIDPRLNVSIAVVDGRPNVTLRANELFEFKARVTGRDTPDFRQALVDFFEKGVELHVNSSALQFEGAPLLSHAFSAVDDGHVTLKFAHEVNGSMQAFEVGDTPDFLFQIDGRFRCGTKYATFDGSLPNSALSVTTTVSAEGILRRQPHHLGLSFNPDKWVGQRVLQLAYFDVIRRFVKNLHGAKRTRLKFFSSGNELFGTEFTGLEPKPIIEILDILNLLHKARFIARQYGTNPFLPPLGSIPGVRLKAIEDLYDLLRIGEARMPKPHFRLPFTATGGPIPSGDGGPGVLRIDSPRYDFDILGSKIQIGPISHFFTCATLERAAARDDGSWDIVMTGSDKSEWIMKVHDPQSPDGEAPQRSYQTAPA